MREVLPLFFGAIAHFFLSRALHKSNILPLCLLEFPKEMTPISHDVISASIINQGAFLVLTETYTVAG